MFQLFEFIAGGWSLLDNWFNGDLKIYLAVVGAVSTISVAYFRYRAPGPNFRAKDAVMLLVLAMLFLVLFAALGWIGD